MPIRPTPVRYTCGRCANRWVFAPLSDALHQIPGVCPQCGHDQPSHAESVSTAYAVLQNWFAKI